MEYMTSAEIREKYLKFFESKGCKRMPSSSLIPDDPSLLLTSAGMVQFKPYFLHQKELDPAYIGTTTVQKCVRTNDIDNIGDARHLSFFEMLGNFSFGCYFKHEMCAWAFEFSTEVLGLPKDKLYFTVFEDDDETIEIWKSLGVAEDHISRLGEDDNFWRAGPTGPCGPCSEIYFDQGPEVGCGDPDCKPGCDCDRFLEYWNCVFTQYDGQEDGTLAPLKTKNIDTGMGLERLAVVCQDVDSLFDVDTVMNITHKVSQITGAHYGESHQRDVSLRVITDHIRSAVFMICDGVLPSNEGRGYVLRRLLRRAARHGKLLGVNEPFLFDVVDTVVHENEGHYPELRERQEYITRVIRVEEENFAKTIDGGIKIFNEMLSGHKDRGETVFSGADAFKLYDTYGFPIDLTQEMVEEAGMTVDKSAFDQLMKEQKARAREARKALGDLGWAGVEFGKEVPATRFVGYDKLEGEGHIAAIVAEEELRDTIAAGTEGILVLDETPFYAEMGGQVADHGVISCGEARFQVTDVQKNKGGKFMHYGKLLSGSLTVGDTVLAAVDGKRRKAVMRAHSATHLLDYALRAVLGDHAHQAGSLVEPDRLRYDFTHFSAVTPEELNQISRLVSEMILDGLDVDIREMPIDQARELGAIALFGEKYGDVVRVVNMGGRSIELCGGTHVDNTAKIGPFRILGESSVASGVRRIEAVTGQVFLDLVDEMNARILQAAEALKTTPAELFHKAQSSMAEIRELHQVIDRMKDKLLAGDVDSLLFSAKEVGGLKVITGSRQDTDAADLRKLGDFLRDKAPNVVAVLGAVNGEKVTLLAVCGKNAVAQGIKAGDIIKSIAPIVGGKGGGKPDSAMGGGTDTLKVDDALAAVDDFVAGKLGV